LDYVIRFCIVEYICRNNDFLSLDYIENAFLIRINSMFFEYALIAIDFYLKTRNLEFMDEKYDF
jgi:hypothetical protein